MRLWHHHGHHSAEAGGRVTEGDEERYRSIFENAVEGIFQTTLDGKFVAVNPALARMYGYDSRTR
jgi:PAS domain S-box